MDCGLWVVGGRGWGGVGEGGGWRDYGVDDDIGSYSIVGLRGSDMYNMGRPKNKSSEGLLKNATTGLANMDRKTTMLSIS